MDFSIQLPDASTLLSLEAAKNYHADNYPYELYGVTKPQNLAYLVDRFVNNFISQLQGVGYNMLRGTAEEEEIALFGCIKPELRNYAGLEKCILVRHQLLHVNSCISHSLRENSSACSSELPYLTKAAVHTAYNEIYAIFDANPDNAEAAKRRTLLQDAAKMLELPELGITSVSRITERRMASAREFRPAM